MRTFQAQNLFLLILIAFLPLFPASLSAQFDSSASQLDENGGPGHLRGFSVRGLISDTQTNAGLDDVRVDLHSFTGGVVASTYTSGEGIFEFDGLLPGAYEIVAQDSGYHEGDRTLDVEGPIYGLRIGLRSFSTAQNAFGGNATVSVRELLIPHKAHDAMEKGLSLLYVKADYPGSVKQFERATQKYPDYYEAYAAMGLAYLEMNDTADSERVLRKALDLSDQKYVDALFLMASLYTSGQRYSDAEPLARKAVELDPNSWQAKSELARALLGLGRNLEANKFALASIQLHPQDANLYLVLADTHIALRDNRDVLDDLDHYLKIAPKGDYADQARKQVQKIRQQLLNPQTASTAHSSQTP